MQKHVMHDNFYHYSDFLSHCHEKLKFGKNIDINNTLNDIFQYDGLGHDDKLSVVAIYRDKIFGRSSLYSYTNSSKENKFIREGDNAKAYEYEKYFLNEFNGENKNHVKGDFTIDSSIPDIGKEYKLSLYCDTDKRYNPDKKYKCKYELTDYNFFSFGIYFYCEEADWGTYSTICNQIINLFNDVVIPKFNLNYYLANFYENYEYVDNSFAHLDLLLLHRYDIDIAGGADFVFIKHIEVFSIVMISLLSDDKAIKRQSALYLLNNSRYFMENIDNINFFITNKYFNSLSQDMRDEGEVFGSFLKEICSDIAKGESWNVDTIDYDMYLSCLKDPVCDFLSFNPTVFDFITSNNIREIVGKKEGQKYYIYGSKDLVSSAFPNEEIVSIFIKKKIDSMKITVRDFLRNNENDNVSKAVEFDFINKVPEYAKKITLFSCYSGEINAVRDFTINCISFFVRIKNFIHASSESGNIFHEKYLSGIFLYDHFQVIQRLMMIYIKSRKNAIVSTKNIQFISYYGGDAHLVLDDDFDKKFDCASLTLGTVKQIFLEYRLDSLRLPNNFFEITLSSFEDRDVVGIRNQIIHEETRASMEDIEALAAKLENIIFHLFNIILSPVLDDANNKL